MNEERPECVNRAMLTPHKVGDKPDVCGVCAGEWPNSNDEWIQFEDYENWRSNRKATNNLEK